MYLHSLGTKKAAEDKAAADSQGGQQRKSQSELAAQYTGTVRAIGDNLSRLERDQMSYDREVRAIYVFFLFFRLFGVWCLVFNFVFLLGLLTRVFFSSLSSSLFFSATHTHTHTHAHAHAHTHTLLGIGASSKIGRKRRKS